MQKLDPNLVSSYDYHLPKSLIASHPIKPKEDARLLVYKKSDKSIVHAKFGEIFDFLPKNMSVLLNDTKVIKARIFGFKQSGGKVELLFNSVVNEYEFKVYIKGKVQVGSRLIFDEELKAIVLSLSDDGARIVNFFKNEKPLHASELFDILDKIGHVPLPPYIKREDTKEDEEDYQTLFAKSRGAVAAPTASLHFSEESFSKLKKCFETEFITLHIGAGTFKGVEGEKINEHTMHSEYFIISDNAQKIIQSDKPILCVGTTVVRSVEYFVRTKKTKGECNLFLTPFNSPLRVNYLLTNFHLPKSTLIMLAASFIGVDETLRIYKEAIDKKYRFFSYGDAMLIL
ncbi:MAG: tRNA preQ1(34) S-adenosylmethionine ribosyltransferase-isomerase QueA [Campylobacteraceae bacterium]|jgi:S-adenosylmethionine:tRNA ribosyltransferase-isomerase|nr:tRNA preQ1(34) S-adenosylmethionine ribosyltransferase-isomerase QueA [Campylobacteraceae bacterium]